MKTNLGGALRRGAVVGSGGIGARARTEGGGTERVLFEPLLADPQEPQFFATYLWAHSTRLASRLGSVGFGQTIGLVRGRDWQVAVPAGGFSQFHIQASTPYPLNPHFLLGLPITYPRGPFSPPFPSHPQTPH